MRIDKEVYKYINHELQHYEENKKELEANDNLHNI